MKVAFEVGNVAFIFKNFSNGLLLTLTVILMLFDMIILLGLHAISQRLTFMKHCHIAWAFIPPM